MKRLIFFSFFDPNKQINDYVIFYLTELKKVSDIIFSSDGELPVNELEKINHLCLFETSIKHGEYDFGSHKRAYKLAIEKDILKNYDWLILANDSCYGPFVPFDKIFIKMESLPLDFWGMTHNTVDKSPHIQSYFVALNKSSFLSDIFKNFILSIQKEDIRRNIIIKYEHGLTKCLHENGYKYDTYMPDVLGKFTNDPLKNWDEMIKKGFPFIKRTLFTRNTYNLRNLKNYKKIINNQHPNYNTDLIEENLNRYPTYTSNKDLFIKKLKKKLHLK